MPASALAHLDEDARRLDIHRLAWSSKPLLRAAYEELFAQVARQLSPAPGASIEIGAGDSMLREHIPGVICCDLLPFRGIHCCADACNMPFRAGGVANLLMFDVLHHLAYSRRFFQEATRILAPGGRIVLVEPFVSMASWPVYRFLHREPLQMSSDPLSASIDEPLLDPDIPLDANQAIPTILFWRDRHRFEAMHTGLRILQTQPTATLTYPLSGGFEGPCLAPAWSRKMLQSVERTLKPLNRWLAFRCVIVLERLETALPADPDADAT